MIPSVVEYNVLHAARGNPLQVFSGGAEALWDGKSQGTHQSTPPFSESNNDFFHTFCILLLQ